MLMTQLNRTYSATEYPDPVHARSAVAISGAGPPAIIFYPCEPGGPNDYVYLLTSRANPEHWTRLLKLIGREDLIGDSRSDTPDARLQREAEVDEIVTAWTRQRTKHEAMAQLSAVGVPVGAVLEPMELTNEPSFRQRGILQTMTHGERTMMMPNWPVRFDGVPTAVKSAPLLGEHTAEVLAEWLGLDAAAVPGLASGRHRLRRWRPPAGSVRPGRKRRPCSLAGSTPRGSPLTGDKFESIS